MNANRFIENPHCRPKQNVGPLKELIKRYELIVNNDIDFPICSSSQGLSIIDLALTNFELDLLQVWKILEERKKSSRYEWLKYSKIAL